MVSRQPHKLEIAGSNPVPATIFTMTLGTSNSQVDELEKALPTVPPKPDAPRMPFKTAYVLTREQEDALVHHALTRLTQIEAQLGNQAGTEGARGTSGDFSIVSTPDSFFGKRERYTARYYNHVEDRKEPNTVYEHSNLTASLSQRITAQMIAKSCSFFFGKPDDDEWFSAEGIGIEDAALSEKVKKYARFVATKCHIKARHAQAVEFAWVRGEAVIKTTHQEKFQIYKRTATFLVDAAGNDILDAHGDYILQSDLWVDQQAEVPAVTPTEVPAAVEPAALPAPDEAEPSQEQPAASAEAAEAVPTPPQMVIAPTGQKVLKRDGVTNMPEVPIWKTDVIQRRLVTWSGPDSRICYFKDFLAPIDASGIQAGEADLIAHLYDKTVMEIAQMFSGQFAEGDDGVADFAAGVELLRNMISDTAFAKSGEGQPRQDFGEQATDGSPNNPKCGLAECWLTYDADGDGIQEEIMLVIDRRNKAPIFYEYTANVTLRGLRPFDVIRPMAVDGRWYGMGAMEYFDPEQTFIDLQLNRKNFRESAAGRTTFWAPHTTLEGQRDPNLKLNIGKTYTLREGYKKEDALGYVTLPEDMSDLTSLIDLFTQFMQIKSGVLSGADRAISNLPSSNTLGEEQLITESGNELFEMFLLRLFPGLQGALESVIDITFSRLDTRQVFTYFNGDAQEVMSLTPDDVRDLALNIRLSITQQRDRQILESGNVADGVIDGFYRRPLALQERTASYSRSRLKSLRVPQSDSIIQPLDPALYAPPAPPPAAA